MAPSPEAIDRAARAWPELQIEPASFSAYVERVVDDTASLDDASLAELYLACGCTHGNATALALFDAKYLDVVPAALAHMKLGSTTLDEVRQLVRQKLLVAEPGQSPKLDDYAGRGKLRGLIQVVSVRTAISLLRKSKGHRMTSDGLAELPDGGHDPELKFMKAKYRAAFKEAFEGALVTLSSRERNFLRLHHFGGLTVEQVGEIYGVHRATATRWLAKIRTTLMSKTRAALGAELGVEASELDSVMALIESRLDVSLQRLLASQVADGAHASEPISDRSSDVNETHDSEQPSAPETS